MALATRPKPKTQHKKRKAQHHRHTPLYLKPYWPYLPMLVIVGVGVFVNNHWPTSLVNLDSGLATSVEPVTRIEAISGSQNSWALVIVVAMASIAAIIFIAQNWFRIHRTLNRGERFLVKHPLFDILLVAICVAGVVLTRTNF